MGFLPSKATVKARCTSLSAWELPREPSTVAPEHVWSNRDMDPVVSLGSWQTGGSMLSADLSWREAIPAVVVGAFCTSIPMVLNGAIGADLHVPFSVIVRASFGYYLGYLPLSRGHLAVLPLFLIPPQKLRPLFLAKLVITPTAALATMAWCVHKAGGAGPVFSQPAALTGSAKAWQFLSSMSSVSGCLATLACNIPDFSRYARTNRGQYVQLPFIPTVYTLGMLLAPIAGIMAADYWVVKCRHVDVPALYDPHGRYRYRGGVNWRALLTLLLAIGPCMPGLIYAVGSTSGTHIVISDGAKHLYKFDWLYGFVVSIVAYTALSKVFPASDALVAATVRTREESDELAAEKVLHGDATTTGSQTGSAVDESVEGEKAARLDIKAI
ncbi:hypothetical protein SCUCBS95973_009357 [Sporothrix curviconia]|uniref:Uncharacterized protein n=1 Tax=Sporothrix curviconia TaxID=1260050 RepID=A0ABP0CUJ8_9PEZI